MPFVDVSVSKKLTPENEIAIKTALGDAISLFRGKSEAWLMCKITDGAHMWFKGENGSDSAFVEVKLFGTVDPAGAEHFTARMCEILEKEAGIAPSRTYVRYTGGTDWGWNGSNF